MVPGETPGREPGAMRGGTRPRSRPDGAAGLPGGGGRAATPGDACPHPGHPRPAEAASAAAELLPQIAGGRGAPPARKGPPLGRRG